jgi:DNA polymerase-3 subunit gamma/tau
MESHFIVSARKYRPATFDTVVGQEHITTTLKNAIQNNQLAHAFLFCGPRGVGKTTCARILAKTINCTNRTADCEACNECESCISFNSNASFNIYELDAASNSGVEDMRSLVEQVRVPPQGSKYKVYIIDEVHMLTSNAFNAFLKTLEEPPPYAIFILATTEKHKIIPTILSRCQIFDFKRIRVTDIAKHLQNIAEKEGIRYDEQGLHIIAEKADGALRDALSLFDQTASFTSQNITYANVIENLNILDYAYYFRVMDAIGGFKTAEVLLIFNEVIRKGFDGHQFLVGLSEHIRNLMVCKDASTLVLLEVVDSVKEQYRNQSAMYSGIALLKFLGVLNDSDTGYKQARNQRLHVELALLRLAYLCAPKNEEADKKKIADSAKALHAGADEIVTNTIVNDNPKQEPKPAQQPVKPEFKNSDTAPKPAQGGFKLGSFSAIKINASPTANEPKEDEKGEDPVSKAVSVERTLELFEKFVEQISHTRPAMHFIFSKSKWEWDTEKKALNISIPQDYYKQEELINYKADIQAFYKKEIFSTISLYFTEGPKFNPAEHKIFNSREKLEYMISKNPALKTLIDKFGLDLMY